eukprot:CAMPEP_0116932988 /NCGR_PEP_ID=MMETSP0467-20121206/28766_1 /TAXON_ID=283647 /ORGANISM="Mesodinium pulex, Strain SPMC105" /LENGTH=115 /DNA_ID=CAMNT_0004613777 /DNA_START=2019 /DNA_END=2366 /DNA_ORIENTATION=+
MKKQLVLGVDKGQDKNMPDDGDLLQEKGEYNINNIGSKSNLSKNKNNNDNDQSSKLYPKKDNSKKDSIKVNNAKKDTENLKRKRISTGGGENLNKLKQKDRPNPNTANEQYQNNN